MHDHEEEVKKFDEIANLLFDADLYLWWMSEFLNWYIGHQDIKQKVILTINRWEDVDEYFVHRHKKFPHATILGEIAYKMARAKDAYRLLWDIWITFDRKRDLLPEGFVDKLAKRFNK